MTARKFLAAVGHVFLHEPRKLSAQAAIGGLVTAVGDLMEPVYAFTRLAAAVFASLLVLALFLLYRWCRGVDDIRSRPPTREESLRSVNYLLTFSAAGLLLCSIATIWKSSIDNGERGVLAATVPGVAVMQQKLGLIEASVQQISTRLDTLGADVASVDAKLDGIGQTVGTLKREVSEDPRKELANMGIAWHFASFREAVMAGDQRTLALFLQGGMNVHAAALYKDPDGWTQGFLMPVAEGLAADFATTLGLLQQHGFDVNHSYAMEGNSVRLMDLAIHEKNDALVRLLVSRGATLDYIRQTGTSGGETLADFPLKDVLDRRQYDLAQVLLGLGADPALNGDEACILMTHRYQYHHAGNAGQLPAGFAAVQAAVAPQDPARQQRCRDLAARRTFRMELGQLYKNRIHLLDGTAAGRNEQKIAQLEKQVADIESRWLANAAQ